MNFLLLIILSFPIWSQELNLMTLNIHGYHPMDEERRFENRGTGKKLSWSHLHYFSLAELDRGLEKRQRQLSEDLKVLKPDILFLQEVGGGKVLEEKKCSDFLLWNTALDLKKRISGMNYFPACRGNSGWITNPATIASDIVTESNLLIFPKGSTPYPNGLIIEGLAILTSAKVVVQDHFEKSISINQKNDKFYFQGIKFTTKTQPDLWWIAINIHGGHKIQNFEQAVATRHFLTNYLSLQKKQNGFRGFIIAGDFNAKNPKQEVSTRVWDFDERWQTREMLEAELIQMNSSSYKPFATIPAKEAKERSRTAVSSFFDWFALPRLKFDESLRESFDLQKCLKKKYQGINPFCAWSEKIDHLFLSQSLEVKEVTGIYQQNNWTDLKDTRSDHPGLWARVKF